MKNLKVFDMDYNSDLEVLVGQNAQDNWDIIDISNQNDIWFHLENNPSSHVILKIPTDCKKIHKQTLLYCAMICKETSKFSHHKKLTIIYTEIKNITKGIDIGSVHTKKIKKIII